jgi:cell division control protein 24
MDPLTITTSILGLLQATAQVAHYLSPYVSAARDTPKIVTQVNSEVVYSRTILLALESLTKNLASIPARRAALIQIDHLIAVFTDGVLLFSELEASLPSLPSTEPVSPRLPLQLRLQWARKESTFEGLLTRLQGFKASISLMLTILQRQVYLAGTHWDPFQYPS